MHLFTFFSKFLRNPSKTWVEKLSRASDRFLDDPDGINDVWSNKTSLLLVFNKIAVFRQLMLFFRLISNFYMIWITMKNQYLVLKNNIFVENQQQWCYVAFSINYSNMSLCWLFCWKSGFESQKIEKSRFWTESQKWFWPPHMLPWQRLK